MFTGMLNLNVVDITYKSDDGKEKMKKFIIKGMNGANGRLIISTMNQ